MIDKTLLVELFNMSGSDKSSSHNYENGYSLILPESIEAMLEIGIANYANDRTSLLAWEKLYPNALIYAIDIDENKLINNGNIKSFKVDQLDKNGLDEFAKNVNQKFDVIIDDGIHLLDPTIQTFESLFQLISNNGVYCIEDVKKNHPLWAENQQTIEGLSSYLDSRYDVRYEIFDTRIGHDDDSVIFCIRRAT